MEEMDDSRGNVDSGADVTQQVCIEIYARSWKVSTSSCLSKR